VIPQESSQEIEQKKMLLLIATETNQISRFIEPVAAIVKAESCKNARDAKGVRNSP
jgi:hypothetical protein